MKPICVSVPDALTLPNDPGTSVRISKPAVLLPRNLEAFPTAVALPSSPPCEMRTVPPSARKSLTKLLFQFVSTVVPTSCDCWNRYRFGWLTVPLVMRLWMKRLPSPVCMKPLPPLAPRLSVPPEEKVVFPATYAVRVSVLAEVEMIPPKVLLPMLTNEA